MKGFFYYYLGYFGRPQRTYESLLKDGRRVRFAVYAVLIPAIGYTLMYLLSWIAGGAPSSFQPWLAIPIEQHFKWDTFIVAVGFGIGVATWASLIHHLSDAFLGALAVIDMKVYESWLNQPTFWRGLLWTLYSIYFLWFVFLFAKGFKAAHRLRNAGSIVLGVISLLVYQMASLVFNR
jgi:hypothetical protein